MPFIFGGIDAIRIFALIEDRKLAEEIAEEFRVNQRDFHVRCIETGKVWESCVHAAEELHVHKTTIPLAIREKRPVKSLGMTFETLRPCRSF